MNRLRIHLKAATTGSRYGKYSALGTDSKETVDVWNHEYTDRTDPLCIRWSLSGGGSMGMGPQASGARPRDFDKKASGEGTVGTVYTV